MENLKISINNKELVIECQSYCVTISVEEKPLMVARTGETEPETEVIPPEA